MRTFAFSLIALLSIVDLAELHAAETQVRPALIGDGPKALINLIDTNKLVEKGQRDGLVMFKCYVDRSGKVSTYNVYRETPGSKLLKEELGTAIAASRFIPAVYNGKRTEVALVGTVVLLVTDGKPQLHVYMNQNHEDVSKGNDFVAPQLLMNSVDWTRNGNDLAAQKARVYGQNGWIELSITVDANGNQKDLQVVLEDPPGFGFGTVAMHAYAKANGFPVFAVDRLLIAALTTPNGFRAGGHTVEAVAYDELAAPAL
jgi:Gram-negative bacterial tonB protein.